MWTTMKGPAILETTTTDTAHFLSVSLSFPTGLGTFFSERRCILITPHPPFFKLHLVVSAHTMLPEPHKRGFCKLCKDSGIQVS
jgi:hypothetical protein